MCITQTLPFNHFVVLLLGTLWLLLLGIDMSFIDACNWLFVQKDFLERVYSKP